MQISYRQDSSYFHKTDAISKLIWGLITAVWLMSTRDILSVISVSLFIFSLALMGAHIPLVRYVKLVLIFLLAGWWIVVYQGLIRPGDGPNIGPLHLSNEGIIIGLGVTLRSFGVVAAGLAFSVSTSPKDLSGAMIAFGIKYRYAHVAYMALRLIPLMLRDYQSLRDVQRIRGIKNGIRTTLRTTVTMLATQMRYVDDTAIALETRGFGAYEEKTILEPITVNKKGILLLLFTVAAIVVHLVILIT